MKRTSMLIKFHSLVSEITNSSTELFVGNSDKSLELIKELVGDYLKVYNKQNNCDYTLESICDVDIITEDNVEEWFDIIIDWELPYWIETSDEKPDYFDFDYNDRYKFDELEKAWLDLNSDTVKKSLIGNIVIQGKDDNSIPYELFDVIESLFEKNSHRVHMG